MKSTKTVTIIGAGLSGLSAAMHLADAGFQVTIVEKRFAPGGRASSFKDSQINEQIDNCQHILLGCCTALIDFLKKLGADSKIVFHDQYAFIGPDGSISYLKSSRWPGFLNLVPSFLKIEFLKLREKISIFKAMMKIKWTHSKKLQSLDKISFGQWLKDQKQSPESKKYFWNMIIVSALNEDIEQVSAKYAFKVFRETFLRSKTDSRMGIPNVPLSELYTNAALICLKNKGAKIIFQKCVQKLKIDQNKISEVELNDGSILRSDDYISAIPFDELLRILPPEIIEKNPLFKNLTRIESSPITGIHLFFDRPITNLDHAILLDQNIHWMFNKTKNFSLDPTKGQYIGLVISAAHHLSNLSKQEIVDLALKELCKAFPKAREAQLIHSVVLKETKATFSLKPGVDELRPTPKTPIKNLFLAGDWTRTDWPATMESAVRSGLLAVHALMKSEEL